MDFGDWILGLDKGWKQQGGPGAAVGVLEHDDPLLLLVMSGRWAGSSQTFDQRSLGTLEHNQLNGKS